MGVPTQRVQSARGQSKAPPLMLSQSGISSTKFRVPPSSTSLKPVLATPKSIENASRSRGSSVATDNLSHGLGKTERVLATNSRIKKDELTRVEMYLSFVNDAFRKKSEVWNAHGYVRLFTIL